MLGENETYIYLWILEVDTIKQKGMKKKNKKRVSQENEKATQNKSIEKDHYKRDKYLSSPPCKILGTSLEVDQRRTLTNWPEKKKTNEHA